MGPVNHGEGESLIENMYKAGVIEEFQATFWLNKEGNASNITIGGIPDDLKDIPSINLQTIKKGEGLWWSVELTGLHYGENNIKQSRVAQAILDTGSSLIFLPTADYASFVDEVKMVEGFDCEGAQMD